LLILNLLIFFIMIYILAASCWLSLCCLLFIFQDYLLSLSFLYFIILISQFLSPYGATKKKWIMAVPSTHPLHNSFLFLHLPARRDAQVTIRPWPCLFAHAASIPFPSHPCRPLPPFRSSAPCSPTAAAFVPPPATFPPSAAAPCSLSEGLSSRSHPLPPSLCCRVFPRWVAAVELKV
jgi:hypothetical protein